MIDEADLGLAFPLQEAHAAALAQPPAAQGLATDAAQPSAGEWLADHPAAYVPFAMRTETVDRHQQRNPSWLLLWVEGDDWLGRQVSLEPVTVEGLTVPETAGGRQTVVRVWTPSWLPADPGSYFPRADQLPTSIPSVAGLMDRYVAANPAQPANRYGFETVCRGDGCSAVALYVEVGIHSEPQSDVLTRFEAGIDTTTTRLDKLRVDRDGRLVLRTDVVESQQGMLSIESAGSSPGPAPGATQASAAGWVFPSAPVAATGISLLALVASLVYYFWPAIKGGVAGLGLFSRIDDDKLLDHPARRRIHDAIASEPGIHFQALVRKTGLVRGNVEHHLNKLVAGGLVITRKAPGYTCHFLKGSVDRHVADAAPALRSEGSRAVLQAIAANPGATGRDIAASLGIAPSTVSYHLRRLEEAGLVFGAGAAAGTRLSPLGEQAVAG
jgi:DNA-binding MarR family transcriptional regulator